VIDVERDRRALLRQAAVFTTAAGSILGQSAERRAKTGHTLPAADSRARSARSWSINRNELGKKYEKL
jgi:hypothetical protein